MWPESSRKAAWRVRASRAEGEAYLHGVLQLGVLVVEDAEAERLLGDHLHQHEVATLRGRAGR